MTTDELVSNVLLRATGELSTASFGDDDYSKVVQLANMNIDKWAKETDWDSLYDPGINCGSISTNDSYDLDSSIRVISSRQDDYVQIIRSDGQVLNYQTVPPSELKRYSSGNYCARIGSTLRFNKSFESDDPAVGGVLTVPAYLYVSHLKKANDKVPVDDPNWLVAMTAADWVQSDITLAQNYPGLIAEANDIMVSMKKHNGAQVETVPMHPVTPSLRNW